MLASADNLEKLVGELGHAASILYGILEDGKVSIKDFGQLSEAIKLVKNLAAIDYKKIPEEYKAISDDAERAALAKKFADNLKIGGGTTEEVIEKGFAMLMDLLTMIEGFMKWGSDKAA